jgi:serine/threonine-protein kinase
MKTCPKCGKHFEDTTTLCPVDGEVLKKTEDELLGKVLAGKYRIDEKIDEGGMGCVYRATHVLMEKRLAIKVLHPSLAADDKIVARFTREAKAASRISHPHALTVTDFGEDEGGVVFLVMEYLRGRTLKDIIRAEGPMPLARAAEIIRQVCGALDAAHAEGVVHRDLKSDNIMLEEASGGGDWAKVLDFGIAKIQEPEGGHDAELTAPNLIIGTPQYMSPEQCSQASLIDSRSDLYSLGVILFEMLTGHVPFTGESPTAIMMKHLQEPPPSVLEERRDLPAGVGRVVARALAKRPEDRYQTAGELSEALALVASDEAAVAAAAAAAAAEQRGGRVDTNRIVVPTAPNEPARTTDNEEYEEATVVSGEVRAARRSRTEEVLEVVTPPPAPGFNPWRIMVPALALLAVVFVAFFAMRGPSSASSGEEGPPLTADPNSKPVQSMTPPTGAEERNLAPVSATPTPGAAAGEALPNAPDIGTFNPQMQPSPSPVADDNANVINADEGDEDAGASSNANANANARPAAKKVDTLTNSNAEKRGTDKPANSNADDDDADEPPPPIMPKPKPKQEKPAEPKPTPKPAPADSESGPVVSPF